MSTVRRLYVYAVIVVSMEVVLWGLIGLARETFSPDVIGSGAERLAQALSLILVGVPVFVGHWWGAQRGAQKDMEERASGVRALALYGILLGTLVPVVQNGLALINRLFLSIFDLPVYDAIIGGGQTITDNLIGMAMNALIAAYFIYILREDWKVVHPIETYADVRRLYRYLWVIYGLIMVVGGVQQVISYLLSLPATINPIRMNLPNGMALLVIGVPLWALVWKTAQDTLEEPGEKHSMLRMGILYALALAGVVTVLSSAGMTIYLLLRWILGESFTFSSLMNNGVRGALAIGIPLAGVWGYYGYWLSKDMAQVTEAPRQAGMRRLYFYILSLVGLVATFIGIGSLLAFFIHSLLGAYSWTGLLRGNLSGALATLLVSLPLWLMTWRPMQAEALGMDDAGDHARRSIVRRVYLYLVLFATVIGGMVSAGGMLFLLISALLGSRSFNFVRDVLDVLQLFVLFVLFLAYHFQVLRRDGSQAERALAAKHAAFPVLVFDSGVNGLSQAILEAIQKETPKLPVVRQSIENGLTAEALKTTKAVVLPGDLAVAPPEALRVWLSQFNGSRLMVPRETPGWVWPGWPRRSEADTARQTANAIRLLAEGQEIRPAGVSSGWVTLVYIMAALFGIEMVFVVLGIALSTIFG
jgi:hypothetical protein